MKAPSTNIQAPEKLQAPSFKHAQARLVGTVRRAVPARAVAGGMGKPTASFSRNVAPLNAARTAQARRPYPARVSWCLDLGSSLELGAWNLELCAARSATATVINFSIR
jgi:hypothetical protein